MRLTVQTAGARIPAFIAAAALVVALLGAGTASASAVDIISRSAPVIAGMRTVPPDATWLWPIPPPRRITEPFRAPPTPYSAGHRGIDLAVDAGAPVTAMAAGIVSFAGVVVDRPLVSITHPNGLVSSMEPVEPTVTDGEVVQAGQQIGTIATGGHCGSGCLHVGVRLYGEYVNPLLLLGELERAVLLPNHGG
ncbi:hypothetical protein GCM10027416_13930 [Okibacterium endophyticum]